MRFFIASEADFPAWLKILTRLSSNANWQMIQSSLIYWCRHIPKYAIAANWTLTGLSGAFIPSIKRDISSVVGVDGILSMVNILNIQSVYFCRIPLLTLVPAVATFDRLACASGLLWAQVHEFSRRVACGVPLMRSENNLSLAEMPLTAL